MISYHGIVMGLMGVEGIQYNRQFKMHERLSKFLPYMYYRSFIKKTLNKNKYDKLIVFGPQLAIFLSGFFVKKYCQKYIFDYRDLSIEQKSLFKNVFSRFLKHSVANFISSPGFEKCLPHGFEYYISHNFNIKEVKATLECPIDYSHNTENIEVLTIGGIRDYSSNIKIVQNLVNNESISKFDLLSLFNKYFKDGKIEIIPKDSLQLDKSLRHKRNDFSFIVPSYEQQVKEMKEWVYSHVSLYSQYHIG